MADVSLKVTGAKGSEAGTVSAPAEFFGQSEKKVEDHVPLIHQVVVAQLAAARRGTSAVKHRGQVSGGGKKPWRQKGTGRARQGSIRAPQWVGGGTVFGPVPRQYSQRTPKKMKAAALRYALSNRASAGRVHVVVGLPADKPSTKGALSVLQPIVENRFTTVVLSRKAVNEWLSIRNLPNVHLLFSDQLNTYDVVTAQDVVFTKDSLKEFLDSRHASVKEA